MIIAFDLAVAIEMAPFHGREQTLSHPHVQAPKGDAGPDPDTLTAVREHQIGHDEDNQSQRKQHVVAHAI